MPPFLVLFDGVCKFCNRSVNFIIARDPGQRFYFSPLQSQYAQQVIRELNISENNSIIFIEEGKIYTKSAATLHILKHLSWPWKLGYVGIMIPRFIRDYIYNIFARNRYKWFGTQACRIPAPDEKRRFIEYAHEI